MNVIETRNLTKIYGDRYIALNGADLSVPQGAVYGLVGPNGAGKTTTIRLLLGLHSPTAGSVRVFGEPMTPNATGLRRRIGYLPTNPRFPQDMTPIGYLDFVGKISGLDREVRKPRLAALLRAVGLLGAASQKVKSFSTGMTTRLGIAASLINDPDLLIWDEPTSGLDPEGRKYTIDLIRQLGQTKTIIVSSHNLGDIKKVCTHVGIISEGKLIFSGPVGEMMRLTRSNAVQIDLAGEDLARLDPLLEARASGITWEHTGPLLRVYAASSAALTEGLRAVLAALVETGISVTAINSLQDEMVEAFIHLLEEERSHGFARLLHLGSEPFQAADNGIHGAARTRSEGRDPVLGDAHLGDSDGAAGAGPDDHRNL